MGTRLKNVPTLEDYKAKVQSDQEKAIVRGYAQLVQKFAKDLGYGFYITLADDPESPTTLVVWHIEKHWYGTDEGYNTYIEFDNDRTEAYVLEHVPEELVEMWFKRHG